MAIIRFGPPAKLALLNLIVRAYGSQAVSNQSRCTVNL